jgi:hypothetical protein
LKDMWGYFGLRTVETGAFWTNFRVNAKGRHFWLHTNPIVRRCHKCLMIHQNLCATTCVEIFSGLDAKNVYAHSKYSADTLRSTSAVSDWLRCTYHVDLWCTVFSPVDFDIAPPCCQECDWKRILDLNETEGLKGNSPLLLVSLS